MTGETAGQAHVRRRRSGHGIGRGSSREPGQQMQPTTLPSDQLAGHLYEPNVHYCIHLLSDRSGHLQIVLAKRVVLYT
jgi:hypothetical protein